MEYFNYQTAAREAHLTDAQLRQVIERVRRDYPTDDMLREIQVLRTCRAIGDGHVTLEQVLNNAASS